MDWMFWLKVGVVLFPVVVVAGVYLWFSRKYKDDGKRGSAWPDRTEAGEEDEDFWR